MDKQNLIAWSPRVRPEKIRRLYESDARGLLDEELLDEVGFGLYSRCKDILEVSQAVRGRVKCRQCGTLIARVALGKPEEKREVIVCLACAWQILWEDYLRSYQGQRLYAGLADPVFEGFLGQWEKALTPQAKLLAIDSLIHAFHLFLNAPGRPVGVNVIHGKVQEVIDLINGLASGPGSTPGVGESRSRWGENLANSLIYAREESVPEFGEKKEGVEYVSRPGAYAVVIDGRWRVAVIQASQGVFLPGGGSLPGEIPADTLRREVQEECGRAVTIRRKIGEAVSYLYAPREGIHYRIHGHFFSAAFGKRSGDPVEMDHLLTWMEIEEAAGKLPSYQAWALQKALDR